MSILLHCQLEVDVNVTAGLANIRLADLPHTCVPSGPLASALATKAKALRKKGILRPFVFEVLFLLVQCCSCTGSAVNLQELHDYLHHWCVSKPKDGIDAAEAEKVKQRLTVLQWTVAFDHFALTAAVCPIDGEKGEPIWRYSSAMCHKHIVFKVRRWGVGSVWRAQVCFCRLWQGPKLRIGRFGWVSSMIGWPGSSGHDVLTSVRYLCLLRWCLGLVACFGQVGFDVNVACREPCRVLLMEAEAEFDRLEKEAQAVQKQAAARAKEQSQAQSHQPQSKGQGKRDQQWSSGGSRAQKREWYDHQWSGNGSKKVS